jgi:hypothetical protein
MAKKSAQRTRPPRASHRGESASAFFVRPDIAATIQARDFCIRLDALLQQLPGRWGEAAELVAEGGVQAGLQVALAFCRWYESDAEEARRYFRETGLESSALSFLNLRAVKQYRRQIEGLLPPARATRGRPRAPELSHEDRERLKGEYTRRLAEHRRQQGPAGPLVRKRILRDISMEVGLNDPKRLSALIFRKTIKPA